MKVAFLYNVVENYLFFKNSSTNSGVIIDSTNVYAPVFGDFTILMALDNLFEAVCNVATVFFAMTNYFLFVYFNKPSNVTI
ncbi:MAG: hypothetical protein RL308_499 [Bacteroidota bacterium]